MFVWVNIKVNGENIYSKWEKHMRQYTLRSPLLVCIVRLHTRLHGALDAPSLQKVFIWKNQYKETP